MASQTVQAYSKVTLSSSSGSEVATMDLIQGESNKPFRHAEKNWTFFVQQFSSSSTHKVIVNRDLGGLTAYVELAARPSDSSGTSKSFKLGNEQFTATVSNPKGFNTSTGKWVEQPKSF
eukprot:TRINITY_DN1900_c0_g1_i1.p1 TRINITY_DN1900_c0_g1~~TRINITY_DN1900_c0_g1_i1.p1  ORF type:complete len:119 (+),score=11.11 TRINITY_DN1900_c0_g1_i1:18-374(+)